MEDLDAFSVHCFAVHPTNTLPPYILLHAFSGAPGSRFLEEAWNPDVIEVTQKVGFIMAPADLVGPPPVDKNKVEVFFEHTLDNASLGMLLGTEMVVQTYCVSSFKVVNDAGGVGDYFLSVDQTRQLAARCPTRVGDFEFVVGVGPT